METNFSISSNAQSVGQHTEDVEGAGGTDDDLSAHGGHADLNARVSILAELTSEELVEFGVENTVLDEFSLLRDVSLTHIESCTYVSCWIRFIQSM